MRRVSPLIALLLVIGCGTDRWEGDHSREELAALRGLLAADDIEVVLECTEGRGGQRVLSQEALARLSELADPAYLKAGPGDHLGVSYRIVVRRAGAALGRIDLHTQGLFGRPGLMLIYEPYSAQLLLSAQGEVVWLDALDAVWDGRTRDAVREGPLR